MYQIIKEFQWDFSFIHYCFKKWRSLDTDFTLSEHSIKVDSESSLIIEEKTFTASDSVSIQTLFNTDAEINIIFQHFIVKHQLKYMKNELSQLQFIDDQRAYYFEVY